MYIANAYSSQCLKWVSPHHTVLRGTRCEGKREVLRWFPALSLSQQMMLPAIKSDAGDALIFSYRITCHPQRLWGSSAAATPPPPRLHRSWYMYVAPTWIRYTMDHRAPLHLDDYSRLICFL